MRGHAKHVIEAALLAFITTYRSSQDSRLCLAGGVAENSVAVGTLASAGLFDDIYVVHTQSIGMFSSRWTEMIYPGRRVGRGRERGWAGC